MNKKKSSKNKECQNPTCQEIRSLGMQMVLKLAAELIELQRRQDIWASGWRQVRGSEFSDDPVSGDWLLLNMALDILAFPKDNTVETNACEIANKTGKWPEGSFCRGFIIGVYHFMVISRNDIKGYVEVVLGIRPPPSDDELDAFLYGQDKGFCE